MVTQTPSHAADPICYFHCLDRRGGGIFLNLWLVKGGGGGVSQFLCKTYQQNFCKSVQEHYM
jgi:hypothetical protein